MNRVFIFQILFFIFLNTQCIPPKENSKNPFPNTVFYQIYTRAFYDSNGDGLRLDAARHVYDIESPMVIDSSFRNYIWWRTFCDEMKKVNPDAFLLGEIWSGPKVMASYLKTGMHAVFNFPFSEAMLNSVRDGKNYNLVNQYLMLSNQYSKAKDSYGDATFLINHDTKRLINELDYDKEKAKLAVSILMTFPGSPFIYYGEELGYEAEWPLLWLPMLWDEEGKEPGQTSWILGDSTIKNGILTVKYDKSKVSQIIPLSVQQKDSSSIFHFYRKQIRLRTSSKALRDGNLIKSGYDDPQILSFRREHENESILVIHNLSSDSKIIEMSNRDKSYTEVFYESVGFKMDGTKMYLQPFCSVILKKK